MTTWDAADPGNRRMDDQRDDRLRVLVERLGRPVGRALDVGCGRGTMLDSLGLIGVGVDLGLRRLRLAPGAVAQADATRLPFPDGAFDLVVASNVISSIPADPDRRATAAEMARALGPDGVILWYDQRWPNPGNGATRPVTRHALVDLFPSAVIEVEPVTVLPALARALPRRYDTLHRARALRSHLIGLLRLP